MNRAAYTSAMRSLWRHLLLCLLALALPLQGLAAARMHLGMAAAPAVASEASALPPCHQAMADAQTDATHTATTQTPAHTCAACALCAAFGGGLALPSAWAQALPPVGHEAPRATQGVPAPPFLTSGPDRPPRRALAH